MSNGSYKRLTGNSTPALYKIDFPLDISNSVLRITGEGNTDEADDYALLPSHGRTSFAVTKSKGPSSIKLYRDEGYNYYVYLPTWSIAILYFDNRIPVNILISATQVDTSLLGSLMQIGI